MARRSIVLWGVLIGLAACSAEISNQPYFDASKYHHTEDGFRNPPDSPVRKTGGFRFARFIYKRLTADIDPALAPDGHVLKSDEVNRQFKAAPEKSRITWIGHANFLIGLDGLNILTDPFFSERALNAASASGKIEAF